MHYGVKVGLIMSVITPIETLYNGYRFRSRLEARWAVFLDALGVDYMYEPQGFVTEDGETYLPDFKVKCYGTRGFAPYAAPFDLYIEVKGEGDSQSERKLLSFAKNMEDMELRDSAYGDRKGCPVLVVGDVPNITCEADLTDAAVFGSYDRVRGFNTICPFNYQLIDGDYFAAYPAVRNGCFFLYGDDCNYILDDNGEPMGEDQRIMRAYQIARTARFEHGETPNPEMLRRGEF